VHRQLGARRRGTRVQFYGAAYICICTLVAALSCVSFSWLARSAAVDLSGTWAELRVLADSVTFPLVGQLERKTTLIHHVVIAHAGASLSLRSAYCAAEFDNGPSLATTVETAFVRSLDPVLAAAVVDGPSDGAAFAQAWCTEVHGVRLEHPDTDPLPTSAADPRVFDQDGDGHPGITVRACAFGLITGDVYVVQRLRTRLEGRVVSADRIEGTVQGSVEQVILGATNSLFLGAIVSRPDPVAAHSYFVLERVDATADCDDVLSRRGSVFGG